MEFLSVVIKIVACTKAVKYSVNICKCKDILNLVPCVSLFSTLSLCAFVSQISYATRNSALCPFY